MRLKSDTKQLIDIRDEIIGIIGAGYLGRTLAATLIEHGYPKKRLMISYRGNLSTLENIKEAGLIENITDNKKICQESTIIFIAVKPHSLKDIKALPFTNNSLVVSCMAGISLASLEEALGINVFRIMPSGPDTIKEKKGIVAVFPKNHILTEVLSFIDLQVYELQNEEIMHIFTVGVCLPAALLLSNKKRLDIATQ
jgi:pyrroline-5-carboxylate reductase